MCREVFVETVGFVHEVGGGGLRDVGLVVRVVAVVAAGAIHEALLFVGFAIFGDDALFAGPGLNAVELGS